MSGSLGGVVRRYPVRIDDLDAYGIVYHARYLAMLDNAVFDWWNEQNWPFNGPHGLVIRSVNIEYLAPIARLGSVDIRFAVTRVGTTSATYSFEFRSGDVLHAKGERVMVFLELASGKPTPLPADLLEAAAPLLDLRD